MKTEQCEGCAAYTFPGPTAKIKMCYGVPYFQEQTGPALHIENVKECPRQKAGK